MNVVYLGGKGGGPQKDIAEGGLATRVRMAVEQGEEQCQCAAMLPLAGKKYPFPGYETVIKYYV